MKTFWDHIAEKGLYQMGPSGYRLYILDRLVELGVKSVLEEGCGTGPIYQLIKDNPKWYTFTYKGTDFAAEMIKVCKEHFPEGKWEVEDARHPTEPDNSYDCVLLIDTLDHLDDYSAVFQEATRISKKYICFSLWRNFVTEGTNLNNINMMERDDGKTWDDTHLQEYSKDVLFKEFKKNNLKLIELDTTHNDTAAARTIWILEKQ